MLTAASALRCIAHRSGHWRPRSTWNQALPGATRLAAKLHWLPGMTRLATFFREAGRTLARDPQVRAAAKQVERDLSRAIEREAAKGFARFVDRFEPAQRKAPVSPEQRASNEAYVTALYRDLLGREPDADGLASHLRGLETGMSRAQIRDVFLGSDEYRALQLRPAPTPELTPAPAPVPTPAPPRTYPEPGPALSTVPPKAEYLDVPLDQRSLDSAVLSSARWVRENRPQYFNQGEDRSVAFAMMTEVIGILRAHGYDAHRVVNHPSFPMGHGNRYGSDAVVVQDRIYDVFGAWGEPGRGDPQAMFQGPYAAGRLRE